MKERKLLYFRRISLLSDDHWTKKAMDESKEEKGKHTIQYGDLNTEMKPKNCFPIQHGGNKNKEIL